MCRPWGWPRLSEVDHKVFKGFFSRDFLAVFVYFSYVFLGFVWICLRKSLNMVFYLVRSISKKKRFDKRKQETCSQKNKTLGVYFSSQTLSSKCLCFFFHVLNWKKKQVYNYGPSICLHQIKPLHRPLL